MDVKHTNGSGPAPAAENLRKKATSLKVLQEEQRTFRPDIYWYLSFRCNLACEHCSVQSSPWVDTSEDLKTDECMEVIEQMAELNVRTAMLTGGEVLIRPDALDIMERLGEKGINIGLETNGLRFDQRFVDLARKLQERKQLAMTISLDGGTRETHERLRGPRSFDRTVRGFHFLREHGIRFHIQCVLNGINVDTIPDLYELAQELYPAAKAVQWAVLNPVGRGVGLVQEIGLKPEHVGPIFETLKAHKDRYEGETVIKVPPAMVPPKFLPMVFKEDRVTSMTTCQFPLLGVLPNGDVTICAVSRDNNSLHFGNIRDPEMRLAKIWKQARMDLLRSEYVAADHLDGVCGDCIWKYKCKGACRAWSYEEGGSFSSPFPVCEALDEAGAFPQAYRLSYQNTMAAAKYQQMQVGCACGASA